MQDPYQVGNPINPVERSRDDDLYDLMQNSLNHDANLNQSYDFDIDPPEEAGNALENNEDKVNIEEQKIKENSEAKNSNKNEGNIFRYILLFSNY